MLFESLFNNYDYWRKDGEKYSREIELPGVKKGDLKVRIDGDLVRLYFERGGRKGEAYLSLPKGINREKVKGKLEDGILTLEGEKGERGIEIEIE